MALPLTLSKSLEIIGGLSNPSKMPWYSWSTPAQECITGQKLHKEAGTVCSKCYALKGFYMFANAKKALALRFRALQDVRFEDAFVFALTEKYQRTKATYLYKGSRIRENRFRWHDSGDIHSAAHLQTICNIASRTPFLDHWLPTREIAIVKEFVRGGGKFPSNLTVRYSNPLIGAKLRNVPHGMTQSSVGRDNDAEIYQCPAARKQGNKCLDCRACWDTGAVNYPLH